MPVTFEIPEAICRYTDGKRSVTISGATIGLALEDLFGRYPGLRERVLDQSGRLYPYLLLFLNEEEVPRGDFADVSLTDGDRLELIAAAEGG